MAAGAIPPFEGGERRDPVSAVRRHPIITFFVLAYAISWGFLPIESVRFLPSGPLLAALIVIPITQGVAGLQRTRLPDDPLAREVVLVRCGHRTAACGPPGHRRDQRRGRGGRPFADLRLPDHLPHDVRRAPGQPSGWAAGRASGLERGRPPGLQGRLLAASRHRDPGAARCRLAPAYSSSWRRAVCSRPSSWPAS